MLACDEGSVEMVDLLLQYSADPNLQQPVGKIQVLYYTVRWELFAWHLDQAIFHVANCMHAVAIHTYFETSSIILIWNFTIVVFTISSWFLLGTGRMPHLVGGAMGMTLSYVNVDVRKPARFEMVASCY